MNQLPQHKKIILFDGVCNLCNTSINYVIDKDINDVFRFVSLQSNLGQEIQRHIGVSTNNLDSIILYIPNEAYYIKSSAALKIMHEFKGIWNLTKIFFVLPEGFRNVVYDFVAKNRYKWYGKTDACRIPTPELKAKFLS